MSLSLPIIFIYDNKIIAQVTGNNFQPSFPFNFFLPILLQTSSIPSTLLTRASIGLLIQWITLRILPSFLDHTLFLMQFTCLKSLVSFSCFSYSLYTSLSLLFSLSNQGYKIFISFNLALLFFF